MKRIFCVLCVIIIAVISQGCGTSVGSEEYIKDKLTAHTWERYSNKLSSYIRYTFNGDGTYEYEREYNGDKSKLKHQHGTWSVRENILFYKSKSIYSSGETEEYTYVELNEEDVANDIFALGDDEFYVSDDYFVWGGVSYSVYGE